MSRIRTEDVTEDSSRNTRDVEGAQALIAVHEGTPIGLGEGRDDAQWTKHVEKVPLPPHIVVEDVADKEDDRPSEAESGEGEETMDIDSEREDFSGNEGDAGIPDFDEEAAVESEGDAAIPDFDDGVSDLSPRSEEVRTTDNNNTDVSLSVPITRRWR